MLVSAVHWSESGIWTHIPPASWFTPHPSPLGHYRPPRRAPCAIRQLPTSRLFYTSSCIDVSATLSALPTFPSPHCMHKSLLYVCISISALQIGSSVLFFQIPYIYIYTLIYNVCFSLSDFLHSVWQTLGPATTQQMTQFHSFWWLSSIPLYLCTTSFLSIPLLMDTCIVSMWRILQRVLQWTLGCMWFVLNYGFLTIYVQWSDAGSYGSSHSFLVLILRTCFFPTYSRIVSVVCIFFFSLRHVQVGLPA